MVDEPELNLHPANQRRIARLFACLVNLGVKVFITTHSDYIVKELNTLIMLNHDRATPKKNRRRERLSTVRVNPFRSGQGLYASRGIGAVRGGAKAT